MIPRSPPMMPRLSQSPQWPKVESITTCQLHYCWDKRPPVYKQLWFRSRGSRQDSTALDETWALARASNKPLYAFALLWTSYSLSFGDSDTGHNTVDSGSWWWIGRPGVGHNWVTDVNWVVRGQWGYQTSYNTSLQAFGGRGQKQLLAVSVWIIHHVL